MKTRDIVLLAAAAYAVVLLTKKKAAPRGRVIVPEPEKLTAEEYNRMITRDKARKVANVAQELQKFLAKIRKQKPADAEPWYNEFQRKGKVGQIKILF